MRVSYLSGTNQATTASSSVELIVRDQAHITVQPQGIFRTLGASASFSVTASGDLPIGYQWRLNGTNLTDDSRVSGAGTSNLTTRFGREADVGNYDVTVSNFYGGGISQAARLLFRPTTRASSSAATRFLSAITSGPLPPSLRWQKGG